MSALRDRVAAELSGLLGDWGLRDPWSEVPGTSTRTEYAPHSGLYTLARLDFQGALIAREFRARGDVSRDKALGVVITAGPPGAGKTSRLRQFPEFAGFRDIDADGFKDPLLREEHRRGRLEEWRRQVLADGKPLALRELSSYVHAESTEVANMMREESLRRGENVVIHGTLASAEYATHLLARLSAHGYQKITVFDVEVPEATAVERALRRWWEERNAEPGTVLGGRFVPAEVVRMHYEGGGDTSRCAENAERFADTASDLGWNVVRLRG
ncbi:zeta toxin family protein [Mycetocola spongiae]|uniref:zeta toxin family protein n=1 Tax=Mycetocola spongiae TaxID=2859226 RepID=UPI001CF1069F|nr:zeta toxin family protein [Mycetocola spongiae]UCR88318.1 zeta toxin family protein [Mycetocola spongiae]